MYSMPSEVSVFNVLRVVRFYTKQIVFLAMLIAFLLVFGNNKLLPEKYETSVLVSINFNAVNEILYGNSQQSKQILGVEFSQSELLSRKNIGEALKLIKDEPEDKPNIIDKAVAMFGYKKRPKSEDDTITEYQKMILVQSETPTSQVIELKIRSRYPDFAKELLNALVTSYIESRKNELSRLSTEAIKSLKLKNVAIQNKIDKTLDGVAHSPEKDDASLGDTLESYNQAKKEANELKATIAELELKKVSLESILAETSKDLPVIQQNTLLSTTDEIAQKEIQLSNLRARYTEKHPEIKTLVAEINDLKKSKRHESVSIPNQEYSRIKTELAGTLGSLQKAKMMLKETEAIVNRGAPVGNIASIDIPSELIDKMNVEAIDTETQLINEQIRFDTLQHDLLTMIRIIDNAASSSLLIKSRFILMLGGLMVSGILAVFIYWVYSYLTLVKIQAVYGRIIDLPKVLPVNFISNENIGSGRKLSVYSVIDNNEIDERKDGQLMVMPSSLNENIRYLDDIVQIEIARKVKFFMKNWLFYLMITIGYSAIIIVIFLSYLNEFYNK